MRLFLLAALFSGSALAAPAFAKLAPPPALTLKEARALGAGSTVTVRAVVLNGAEMGNIRYIQDGTAGLALYAQPGKLLGYGELQAGDSIQVTGQLKTYNGLLEMDPVVSFRTLASGIRPRAVVVPMAKVTAAFAEANESRLVEIKGVKRLTTPAGGPVATLAGNANYLLNGVEGALLRVAAASTGTDGLVDAPVPTAETFDVRGVMSQFAPSGSGGYQLLPRLTTDLVLSGGLPLLTEVPVPVDVTPTSFTVLYSTLNAGDTRVRYGLSPQNLSESRVDNTYTRSHSITLTDLTPGATYYVAVGSRNAAGTQTATPVPFITPSGKRVRTAAKK